MHGVNSTKPAWFKDSNKSIKGSDLQKKKRKVELAGSYKKNRVDLCLRQNHS